MVKVEHSGDFKGLEKLLNNIKVNRNNDILAKYGELGVQALMDCTPKESGLTANSWSYEIVRDSEGISLYFSNSNVSQGWANIAILLQHGHGTRNGGYVKGRDYINPAVQPIFDTLAEKLWREVTGS